EEFGTIPRNVDVTRSILTYRARDLVARHYGEVARDVYRIVKRGGGAGFKPADLVELGLSETEADALVAANVSSVGDDGKPFEAVPSLGGPATRYRLWAVVPEASAIARFGTDSQDQDF